MPFDFVKALNFYVAWSFVDFVMGSVPVPVLLVGGFITTSALGGVSFDYKSVESFFIALSNYELRTKSLGISIYIRASYYYI